MYSKAVMQRIKEFIDKFGSGIAKSIVDTGLYFPAVVAQSAYESGYGDRIPKDSFNFGGIKYNPSLAGVIGKVTMDTTEFIKGKKVIVKQDFSKFKDVESGFRATIRVLLSDRYKNARANAKTPEDQVLMIAKAGYTTTPAKTYLAKMQGIFRATQGLTGLGRIS